MPTYNSRGSIDKAIDSVLAQTLSEWELIIVDDASTDGTSDFIRDRYKDPRISVLTMRQNSGSGHCRNVAIDKARGDYIAVLDADDQCHPSRLEKQATLLRENADVDVVSCQVEEFGDWGGPLLGRWPTHEATISQRQQDMKMPVPHPGVMFRCSVLRRVGGYDVTCRRAQDYALFLRLTDCRILCLEEALVRYKTQRPIPIGYAIRNQLYSDLASRRHQLRMAGVPETQLPQNPRYSLKNYLTGLKSWCIRTTREFLHDFSVHRK